MRSNIKTTLQYCLCRYIKLKKKKKKLTHQLYVAFNLLVLCWEYVECDVFMCMYIANGNTCLHVLGIRFKVYLSYTNEIDFFLSSFSEKNVQIRCILCLRIYAERFDWFYINIVADTKNNWLYNRKQTFLTL